MGKGLTREQLANQVGCAVITLRKIEAEERHPSVEIVQRLAAVLNIPQDQNTAFLRFARGDWRSAPTEVLDDFPWLASAATERRADVSQPTIQLATFLFTDIEGSAKLWETAPEKMKAALQRHHAILQEAITSNGGAVFQIVGDAFCAAFPTVLSAVSAAISAQQELHREPWELPFPIRVRMGIHTGEAERSPNNPLFGGYASNQTLNRVARILSAAHGGQILLSLATTDLVKDSLPADTELRDMGEYHLKNLVHPERLFQLNISGLPSEFPPLNTLTHRNNLPINLTSFIGREKEQAQVIDLLTKNRLVTLTGAGGIGKTRLSLQVGQKLLNDFAHGTWFVELAPILDPLLVPRTTAIAIGLRDEPQRPIIDMLCDYLRDKQVLLILDNCEHLLDACISMTDRLLRSAPTMHILASSREALGVAGEVNYRVPSLGLPDVAYFQPIEALRQYEAVTLFIERAKSGVPDFVVTNEKAAALVQICHCLDGIPLAIELAAAKVHVLSVEQIAKRLEDRFHLLTSSNRVALERHQTLRATIDWSYNLLSASEKILFRRLSVFVGGWTLEAAESVCSDESIKSEEILNLLEQLIGKSLVIMEEVHHESRYRMLETIRQYANEKLDESGDNDLLRDRHLEYFCALAKQAQPQLRGGQQSLWLNRLENELDNIRAALAWAQDGGPVTAGLHLAVDLLMFWLFRTYFREPARALEHLLEKPLSGDQIQLLARAHTVVGWLEYYQRDALAKSLAHAKESERLSVRLGPKGKRDLATARNLLLTLQLHQEKQPMGVLQVLEENLNLLQEVGDRWGMAFTLSIMGMALTLTDDVAGARLAKEQSLALFQECGDHIWAAQQNEGLAVIALEEGKYAEARQRCEAILSFYREASVFLAVDEQLWILGAVAIREEDYVRAQASYTECLLFSQQIGEPELQLAECLIGFAGLANVEKRFERGAQLLGAGTTEILARAARPLQNFDQKEFERLTIIFRQELGNEKFEELLTKGRAMTMEQAVVYALEDQE